MGILNKIERVVFGKTKEEAIERTAANFRALMNQPLERVVAALDEPGIDEDHDFDGCDFCDHRWQFRVRYPRELDGRGTALWLCKSCAEDMPVDYQPYIEAERRSA